MPVTRNQKIIGGIAAALVVMAGGIGVISASSGSDSDPVADLNAITPTFEANFASADDFYGRFDYGYSGSPPTVGAPDSVFPMLGDHDMNCGPPTSTRSVTLTGEQYTNANHFPAINFEQLLWFCAPNGDPSLGHLMTGQTTLGYDHLWFSPKTEYSGITKVCWDINATTEGGKWTEVQFVDHADAIRYPSGTHLTGPNIADTVARGSGGFDLGYTRPGFRPEDPGGIGPNTGLQPRSGTLAGMVVEFQSIFLWFHDQNTTEGDVGWPGNLPSAHNGALITDKATRYINCIENVPNNKIRITTGSPYGTRTLFANGQIPQDARRVVFHDAEYDGPKREFYSPDRLTWHWDNIQIYTTGGGPPPPTSVPTTTTTVPITTSTAVPTTTASTTTTVPATTTTASTTTLPPTTVTSSSTTLPPTTTTTVPDPCPASFNAEERAWCQSVEARF